MNEKCVKLITYKNSQSIDELVISEYKGAKEFKLIDEAMLHWNAYDGNCIVLGAFNDQGNVIATMRGREIFSLDSLGLCLGQVIVGNPICEFPGLALTRAATNKEYQNLGFNSLLRYFFLLYALSKGFKCIYGEVFQGSPRVGLMEKLGYKFFDATKTQHDLLRITPIKQEVLAVLKADKFNSAITLLESLVSKLIVEYPWQGELLWPN